MYRMPYFPASRVASGQPYHVIACRGRIPTSLADFDGVSEFTISIGSGAGAMLIRGVGEAHDGWVRFRERAAPDGRDIRLWHIGLEADGGFTAAIGSSVVLTFGWPLDRWTEPPA